MGLPSLLGHGFGQIRKPAAQNLRRCKQRKERFVLKYTKISEDSTKHRAVGEGDGVAVEVDRAVVGQTRDRAVAGERPYAAGLDAHDRVVRDSRASRGIIGNIDRAGEAAAVFERQIQR